MLEGQIVHLPAPRTHYARDIVFDKDTPIFCTGKQPIIYIKNGVIDEQETEMMAVRWKVFHFNVRIEEQNQKEIPKCPKSFGSLILNWIDLLQTFICTKLCTIKHHLPDPTVYMVYTIQIKR